jgi:hypothetical protein
LKKKTKNAVPHARLAKALADAVLSSVSPEEQRHRMQRVRELGDSPTTEAVVKLIAEFSAGGAVQPLVKMQRRVLISAELEKQLEEEAAAKARAEEAKLLAAPLKLRKAEEKRLRRARLRRENKVKMELSKCTTTTSTK